MFDPSNNGKGAPKIPASDLSPKPLLKEPAVANILGVTEGCLQKARSEKRGLGLIPTVDFGPDVRIIRYHPDVVVAYTTNSKETLERLLVDMIIATTRLDKLDQAIDHSAAQMKELARERKKAMAMDPKAAE